MKTKSKESEIDKYGDEHVLMTYMEFVKTNFRDYGPDDKYNNTGFYAEDYIMYGHKCNRCEANFKMKEKVMIMQDYGERYNGGVFCSKCIPVVIDEAIEYLNMIKKRECDL